MKRSKKITIFVILFFLIIEIVIDEHYAMGLYFKSKLGNRKADRKRVESGKSVDHCGGRTIKKKCKIRMYDY